MTRSRFSAWGAARLYIQIEHPGGTRARLLRASDEIWVGSAPSCQLVLDAAEIAPRHLSIFSQRGKLFVREHAGASGQLAPSAIRRLNPPAAFQLGPYRLHVRLVSAWEALRLEGSARRVGARTLLVAAALLVLGLTLALLHPAQQPPVAAAACAVDRASSSAGTLPGGEGASVLRAVQLLRAGRSAEALLHYRALSARDDSPAPLAVVAGLLEYELACPR